MQDHIPFEEIPIGAGGIVLRQSTIPRMRDGRMSEHLEAIAEETQDRIRKMRSDAEAADVTPNQELNALVQVQGDTAAAFPRVKPLTGTSGDELGEELSDEHALVLIVGIAVVRDGHGRWVAPDGYEAEDRPCYRVDDGHRARRMVGNRVVAINAHDAMARLHDRHDAEQVPIGVTIIGQHFENNRRILIGGNRQILSNRFTPRHLRDVAAASIPTTAGEGQKKTSSRNDTEDGSGPFLQYSSGFSAEATQA
jgi:hypothetical protein